MKAWEEDGEDLVTASRVTSSICPVILLHHKGEPLVALEVACEEESPEVLEL